MGFTRGAGRERSRAPAWTATAAVPAPARRGAAATPRGRMLGNGRFLTLFTDGGTGGAWLAGQALSRFRGDRIEDPDGWFVYLRDLADGAFWSLGERPIAAPPERYQVEHAPGRVSLVRRERRVETRMDVWVDAERPAECREITLHNRSRRRRRVELTSYVEVVLQDARRHADHPAFSNLFVQTEALPEHGVLLARRRPRSPEERHPWLAVRFAGPGPLGWETDRARFLGRGRGAEAPLALTSPATLSATTGDVLDPALVLRRLVELAPGEAVRLELVMAAAPGRDEVLAITRRLAGPRAFRASRERTESLARARHSTQGLASRAAEAAERLAVAMLYGDPRLRAVPAEGRRSLPFGPHRGLVVRGSLMMVEAGAPSASVSAALGAREYWRALGLATTLVVLAHDRADLRTLRGLAGAQAPGVFVLAVADLGADDLARLRTEADLHVSGAWPAEACGGPRSATVDGSGRSPGERRMRPRTRGAAPGRGGRALRAGTGGGGGDAAGEAAQWPLGEEPLRSFNGIGGFTAGGDEYVIRMPLDEHGRPLLPPRPWINVLANPGFGALISESGAGCTWSRNSRTLRITPWSNDPVRDPHDEALYLRDEESGALWSPFPGPVPGAGPYEMRHGFGGSRCRHVSDGLAVETEVFVHASDPVKVIRLRLGNRDRRPRRLSVTVYQRLVMGDAPLSCGRGVITWSDEAEQVLFARSSAAPDFSDAVAFVAPVTEGRSARVRLGADREQFLGPGGSPAHPAALRGGAGPEGGTGAGLDPCFCTQVLLDLAPGERRTCAFLLGEAAGPETIRALVRRLRRPGALEAARAEVRSRWDELRGRLQVSTPVESLDLLVNGWLAYQTLSCRLWGRTAFYQSGGAYGFRDQLQDAAALIPLDPLLARDQILLHAAHQFVEGDVLHWWHPPAGRGIRTRFADDLLWLPYVVSHYVRTTGDVGLLEEPVPFLCGRRLARGEHEALLTPAAAGETASLYEHCCRAIDRSLATGPQGLPLFGGGDWNDGMSRVGREGRGESVWVGFFLDAVLTAFLPWCEARGDEARLGRLRAHQARLRASLESAGWDGAWYRRGYYDDGTPLGSAASDECRIDALVQAWAVLSGAAPRERAERALDAVEEHLVAPEGLVCLLAPPFDRTSHDPGYIKAYVPGVRENGGQYTHAALWVVAALARMGRRARAAGLLERMSPLSRARTREHVAVYQVEPYVVAADISGNPQHRGRGGWTWYTGSAGWMLRVVLEDLLGVSLEGGKTLVVRPAIPGHWPGFRLHLRPFGRTGTYDVAVRNDSAEAARVVEASLDGRMLAPSEGVVRVPLADDGRDHAVEIILR